MKFLYVILLLGFLSSCNQSPSTSETGQEISEIKSPAGIGASLPHLVKGDDEKLYLSWVEKKDSSWVDFKFARWEDGKWSNPELIAKGNDWFVNWADYPMIAVDNKGNMIAHFLAKSSEGTYSYDVNIVLKPVGATMWSDPIIPHKDGTPTEHGFVTLLSNGDGKFILTWLDGRNMAQDEHDTHSGHGGSSMSIRTATIDMLGNITDESELDDRTCECCQTTGAILPDGPFIVYRDRSESEIRDMSFVRKIGQVWTKPVVVNSDNWNIPGCPVNGPRIAARDNQIAIAWFTAANNSPTVKVIFGKGDGTFQSPIVIDNDGAIGRCDIVLLEGNNAIVSWMSQNQDNAVIKARKVNNNGSLNEPLTITETMGSRSSGFPQMEAIGEYVYFAWTRLEGDNTTISMKRLRL